MAHNKDNNADLGDQTIEGTKPPITLDAEIVMPENDIPTAAELDEQLAKLMAEPVEQSTVITPPPTDDLDAQLASLIAETDKLNEPVDEIDEINAQIDAILNERNWQEPNPAEPPVIQAEPVAEAIIIPVAPTESEKPQEDTGSAPIILGDVVTETHESSDENVNAEPAAVVQPASAPSTPESDADNQAQGSPAAPTASESTVATEPEIEHNIQADEAREMLEQTKRLMEQIQAQAQQAQQAQAQIQAQQTAQNIAAQNAADAESLEMMRQAQLMLQQARHEQELAQQTMQAAQKQTILQSQTPTADPYMQSREVDRLKNELDGMRELVNRLTLTISQLQNGTAQQQAPFLFAQQQPRHDGEDREQFKKLESELERMRREIIEKDLRDREKELDRRQKEAENTVKDIRPEMVQMSESRDIAPMNNANGAVGGEFIPLANGVYYSIKDKQVYVMTPASNAAAASPTIEPKRPAPARRPAPKKRSVVARRRPGTPLHRRPGSAPRRPIRPHR